MWTMRYNSTLSQSRQSEMSGDLMVAVSFSPRFEPPTSVRQHSKLYPEQVRWLREVYKTGIDPQFLRCSASSWSLYRTCYNAASNFDEQIYNTGNERDVKTLKSLMKTAHISHMAHLCTHQPFGTLVHTSAIWHTCVHISHLAHFCIHQPFGTLVHTSAIWHTCAHISHLAQLCTHQPFGTLVHI